jgi:hypothetical protein
MRDSGKVDNVVVETVNQVVEFVEHPELVEHPDD